MHSEYLYISFLFNNVFILFSGATSCLLSVKHMSSVLQEFQRTCTSHYDLSLGQPMGPELNLYQQTSL